MSDRISKWRWGGVLLLGVGAVAVAGGIAVAVYFVRNRRESAMPEEQPPSSPTPIPVLLPVQEVPVIAVEETKLTGAVGSGYEGPTDFLSPQLQEYNARNLKNFLPQSFQGSTYQDVYTEVLKWVKPLHSHPPLHAAFLECVLPPKSHEKLYLLSETLQEMASAMNSGNKVPENKHEVLTPILSELSSEPGIKMDQIKSLIVVCDAFKEFPRHIVEKCIKSLPSGKRQQLIELIQTVPYGVDKMLFTEPSGIAIFFDPDLQPIMSRMGFSKPSYGSDLIWASAGKDEEDRLVAGLFLLLGSDNE